MTKKSKKSKKGKIVRPNILANNVSPRPTKPRRQRKAGKVTKGPQSHHVRSVCSVTDPFCPASRNSKWPDGTAGNTLTEQFRGNHTVSTNANGNAAFTFAPIAPYGYMDATVTGTAPAVATFPSAYALLKSGSMLATYGSQYRVVSAGVIVRCVASATTASGLATVGTTNFVSPTAAFNLGQELYPEVAVKAIQPGMEMSWITQPGTGARIFTAVGTTSTNSSDWTCFVLEVTGGPVSAAVLTIEWFMNIEFTVGQGQAIASLARPNPPQSNVGTAAVSKIHSTVGSFIEGGVSHVEEVMYKHATDALSSFLSDPLESLAGLFA